MTTAVARRKSHKPAYLDMVNLVDRFITEADIKESSQKTYRRALAAFVEYVGEKPNMIDRVHILNYKKHLMGERGLKNTTAAGYLSAIRQLFEFLESEKLFPNIAKSIKSPKISTEFKKYELSATQARHLLESIPQTNTYNIRDYAIINLMLRTGLRDIEVHRANIGDIEDMPDGTVLKIQGKGRDAKDRLVILTPATLKPITELLSYMGDHSPELPLFISLSQQHYGHRLDPMSISRIVKRRLRAAGMDSKYYTAHSLRHTFATLARKAGVPLEKIQRSLGHGSITTTQRYDHMIDRFKDTAESAVDDVLIGGDYEN